MPHSDGVLVLNTELKINVCLLDERIFHNKCIYFLLSFVVDNHNGSLLS